MPDNNYPRVTKAEEYFPSIFFERELDQMPPNRKWSCPRDHTIAAYADGVLNKYRQTRVEFHLSACHRCRLLVADVVKAQREPDLPLPPVHLVQKAKGLLGRQHSARWWVWAPAGALAGIALLATLTIVLRKPEQLIVLSQPAPSAPLVSKSEPAPAAQTQVRDVVRKRLVSELLPTIVSPQADGIMSNHQLQFRWKSIPQSRSYEVRVVRSDGDLVWEGQTDQSALQLPSDVTVKDGSYFVWITAYLEDGRIAKSAPVRFLVKR